MDTTVMEYTAEDLIAHKLQRRGILVAKPKFDQAGADLLALLDVDDGTKFCRIQCKGRTLRRGASTHVDIPKQYVTNAFVVFLFVETGDSDATHLFVFFGCEIQATWGQSDKDDQRVYRLTVTQQKLSGELDPYRVTDARLDSMKQLIRHANAKGEFALVVTGEAHVTLGPVTMSATGTVTPPRDAKPLP